MLDVTYLDITQKCTEIALPEQKIACVRFQLLSLLCGSVKIDASVHARQLQGNRKRAVYYT